MSKKALYYEQAEQLYVREQNTITEIEAKLPVSEKTVRTWKAEGDWDIKKQQYLQSKQAFHEELYSFSRKLMKSIEEDWGSGKQVDPGRLYTLTRMLPLITKVKSYEDVRLAKEQEAGEKKKGLSEDVIRKIEQEILGL